MWPLTRRSTWWSLSNHEDSRSGPIHILLVAIINSYICRMRTCRCLERNGHIEIMYIRVYSDTAAAAAGGGGGGGGSGKKWHVAKISCPFRKIHTKKDLKPWSWYKNIRVPRPDQPLIMFPVFCWGGISFYAIIWKAMKEFTASLKGLLNPPERIMTPNSIVDRLFSATL